MSIYLRSGMDFAPQKATLTKLLPPTLEGNGLARTLSYVHSARVFSTKLPWPWTKGEAMYHRPEKRGGGGLVKSFRRFTDLS